jgi:phosphoglycolate phosphatase
MLKLVVFDCDGVMFSSRESNRLYYNHLLQAFDCPPMDEEELHYVHIHNVTIQSRIFSGNHAHIDPNAIDAYRQGLDYTPYLHHMHGA